MLSLNRICVCFWLLLSVVLAAESNSTNVTLTQLLANSRDFQYRGVALGGWLLLEPYITPSLFLVFNSTKGSTEDNIPVDEYNYCKFFGAREARKRLQEHWSTFYNESDFELMSSYGLNMVRIPIGYWAFQKMDDDPYVEGAQEYLDLAIEWAHNHDLKVWVDLHGVPNTQNGFDNSGLRNIGFPGWFNKTEYVDHTHEVLHQIYEKYGGEEISTRFPDTVIGIEVVNEPLGAKLGMTKIKKFYRDTYKDARDIQTVNNTIAFHDAFESLGYWDEFLVHSNTSNTTQSYYNILIDHHHYEVFTPGALNMTISEHLESIKSYSSGVEDELDAHPAVVGEWLAALTDCTPWLNGVGLGARYEGQEPYDNERIGSCANINNWKKWSDQQKKNTRKYLEMQLDQYSSKMNGWIFWTWKTETTIEWDFKRLVEYELMPQPLDDRKYIVNGTDTYTSSNAGSRLSAPFGLGLLALWSLAATL